MLQKCEDCHRFHKKGKLEKVPACASSCEDNNGYCCYKYVCPDYCRFKFKCEKCGEVNIYKNRVSSHHCHVDNKYKNEEPQNKPNPPPMMRKETWLRASRREKVNRIC